MSDDLFMAPQRDDFSHESPIRAFTDWREKGHYAIGKGFRPSVQHLAPYLDAMERKENWRVVQVLDAGNGLTILFRSVRLNIMLSPLQDVEGEPMLEEAILNALAGGDISVNRAREELGRDELPRYHLKLYGFNAKKIKELMEQCPEDTFEVIIGENKEVADLDLPAGWSFLEWRDGRVAVFTRVRDATYEPVEFMPVPDVSHPVELLREMAEDAAKVTGITVDHASFDNARRHTDAPQDDPVNPKHYAGTACAEIGELLSANSYQVLKYIWRLGEKDDPVVELGKALWYLDRERKLYPSGCTNISTKIERSFVLARLQNKSDHVGHVVSWLVSWHHYGKRETLKLLEDYLTAMKENIEAEREANPAVVIDLGRQLEP